GLEQIPRAIGIQRWLQSRRFGRGQAQLPFIEYAGIIQAPLNNIDSGDKRSFDWWLPGIDHPLFAADQPDRPQRVGQLDFAIEHGEDGAAIGFDGNMKLGAANGRGCRWGLEANIGRVVAMKEVK